MPVGGNNTKHHELYAAPSPHPTHRPPGGPPPPGERGHRPPPAPPSPYNRPPLLDLTDLPDHPSAAAAAAYTAATAAADTAATEALPLARASRLSLPVLRQDTLPSRIPASAPRHAQQPQAILLPVLRGGFPIQVQPDTVRVSAPTTRFHLRLQPF